MHDTTAFATTERPPRERFYPVLEHFRWEHLPLFLQDVSKPYADLAHEMIRRTDPDLDHAVDRDGVASELQVGLRKLLEAKDCFVRAELAANR